MFFDNFKSYMEKTTIFFLIALLFISPISRAGVNIFSFLLLLSYIIYKLTSRKFLDNKYKNLKYYFIIYGIILLIGLINAVNVRAGINNFIDEYFKYAVIFIISLDLIRNKVIYKKLFLSIPLSGILVIVYGYYEHFFQNVSRIQASFPNPNPAGTYFMAITLLSMSLALFIKKRKIKLAGAIFSILAFAALIYSGSRGAIIGLFAGFIYLMISLIRYKEKKYKIRVILVSLLLLSIVVILTPDYITNRFLKIASITENDVRFKMYQAGIKMIKDHPILGVGTGQFRQAYSQYKIPGLRVFSHIHNLYIHLAAETGLLGIAVLALLLYKVFKSVKYSTINQKEWWLNHGVIAMLIGLAVHSLFDWTFLSSQVGIFIIITVALWMNSINLNEIEVNNKEIY